MTRTRWQAVLALAFGTVVWVGGVLDDGGVFAGFYGWLVTLMGFVIGGTVGGRAWLTGVLLGAPALLTAVWLTPRGDGDGLWVLVFPYVLFAMACAAAAHWVGAWVVRRRDRRKPPDLRT